MIHPEKAERRLWVRKAGEACRYGTLRAEEDDDRKPVTVHPEESHKRQKSTMSLIPRLFEPPADGPSASSSVPPDTTQAG